MTTFRYLTAGESHGPGLTVIVEGIPAGLEVTEEYIEKQMSRRQKGYGSGGRMMIFDLVFVTVFHSALQLRCGSRTKTSPTGLTPCRFQK
jgi:hypothetical protein